MDAISSFTKGPGMAGSLNQPRYFDQSAAIPFMFDERGDVLICLITSRSHGRWIVPKGYVEPGMSAAQSAAKEALEEAGVKGRIGQRAVGSFTHVKSGQPLEVVVFMLEVDHVLTKWEEADQRERVWLPIDKAIRRLDVPALRVILSQFARQQVA